MNLRHGPIVQPPLPDRTEPRGYDPGPPRRSDFDGRFFVEASVVFAAIVMFVFLASLVGVR